MRRRAAFAAAALCGAAVFGQQAAPVFRVAGTIVDAATHAPLAGAEVQVSPVGKSQLIEVAIADAAAHFGVSPGGHAGAEKDRKEQIHELIVA